jgi:hypothetical protein
MVASVWTRCWLANCLGELGEFAEGGAYAAEAVHVTLPQEEMGKRCWWGIAEALG